LTFPGSRQLANKIDLFHAPDHLIPRLSKIPVVATVMDAIPLVHPEWTSKRLRVYKNMVFRKMARSAQRIITISEYSKADIVHYFGIPPERISVTYLAANPVYSQPVAPEVRRAALQKYGLEQGFFLFVGTIQPRKNVARILEAHRMLPIQMQKACPMVIVGRNGWGSDEILPDLHALQERGCGRWLDDVKDEELHALLQSARALVYPSLYEGFGLPVLEGFAAGLPVISSNTTSIPEVAADAAMLVNPERTEEIAAAMQRLAEDDALAVDMAERGRKRVKEFSWAACARQTLDVYRNLAG
jgi:alpha-1,3-rhamnosyl/mannosyltransferase